MGRKKKQELDAIQKAIIAIEELRNEDPDERKLRLAELKEQFKLLRLYTLATASGSESGSGNDTESEELTAVRNYLEPLGLAPEGTALSELARLAALRIMEK